MDSWKESNESLLWIQIHKMVCICHLYLAAQYGQGREESKELVHEKPWGNLKCMLWSMRSQSEKTTMYCVIPTPQHAGKGRTMETVKRSAVGRG